MDKSQLTENVKLTMKPILMSCNRDHINLVCCHILLYRNTLHFKQEYL